MLLKREYLLVKRKRKPYMKVSKNKMNYIIQRVTQIKMKNQRLMKRMKQKNKHRRYLARKMKTHQL